MDTRKLPKTDSVRELAEFWDTHDLTDFEDRLEEVAEEVFVRGSPSIHAGSVTDIDWSSGIWLFLDIGFSNKKKTCGLLLHDEKPDTLQFNEACGKIRTIVAEAKEPLNLTIEAPLSVAFDRLGNPTRRSFEKEGRTTRYWYNGLGCAVMVAALYLLRDIHRISRKQQVRLFEGFVSFKQPNVKSDHGRDVKLLREVVKTPPKLRGVAIISPESLKADTDDNVSSAFEVAGLNCGVPPVIKCPG